MRFEEQNKGKALSTFYNAIIKYSLIPLCETLGKDGR